MLRICSNKEKQQQQKRQENILNDMLLCYENRATITHTSIYVCMYNHTLNVLRKFFICFSSEKLNESESRNVTSIRKL